jgi:hypothetical protein
MVSSTTSAIVVALSAIAFLLLLNALRKTIARSEWNGVALLGALSVALFSFVYVAVAYSGTWVVVNKQNQDIFLVPPWGRYATMLVGVVVVAVSATIFLRAVRRNKIFNIYNPAAVLVLAVAVVSIASTVLNGDNPLRPAVAVMLAVLAACTVAPRGPGIHVGIATCCVIAAIASGFAIVVHKDLTVMPCISDKCGILGFNFRGIFHHENAFAIFLTLAMPFVYIGFASWEGPVLSAYLLGLVLLAGSRTGSAAAALTFVVLILVRPNIRRPAWAPIRSVLLYLVLTVAFVVGLTLPFINKDPKFLSDRGHFWMLAKDELSDPARLVYGTGMLGWQHVREAGLIHISASYSVHNQWLQVLYSTGLIGLVLFVAALAFLLWQAGRTYSLVVGCVLLPVFMLSMTERPWPIDTADWVMWVVPGALLSYPVARRLSGDQNMETPPDAEEPITHPPAHRGVRGRHRAPRRWRQLGLAPDPRGLPTPTEAAWPEAGWPEVVWPEAAQPASGVADHTA